MHYFLVKETFQHCTSIAPEKAQALSKEFASWEERNQEQITFVNTIFTNHFASRPQEGKELAEAVPSIVHEQYMSSPYNAELCITMARTINTSHLMDYSVRLNEHLAILHRQSP
ncbi:hypothetical protein KIK84_08545 [Curvibacter sp. CHRR-16]|uniref:hypothetical protein n=1 Tax=Curvibacter sp. CHRR-16 TaxID=2835872 RepID=UPI001BD921A4|nr:hypothetical protein [Curvibacter sp. CHRR-16]MBT0570374.1 hypothetical protein [Curvibacter sp. CHRR-16]